MLMKALFFYLLHNYIKYVTKTYINSVINRIVQSVENASDPLTMAYIVNNINIIPRE